MIPRGLLVILLLLALAASAQAEPLGLKQAERMALERNLNLRAASFDTRASAALVRKGYGIYDPRLEVLFVEGESRDLTNRQDFTSPTGTEHRRFDFSVTQKLPFGTDLRLSFENRRDRVFTPPRPFINPEYDSELRFALVQPLLRNFGRTVTEQEILFAVKDKETSIQDLRDRAFSVLAQTRDAYFDVLRLHDNLAYRETSLELASRVLDENRIRVETGVLAPVEVLEAEVGAKSRERDLLDARREYEDALDNLALLLNFSGMPDVAGGVLGQPEVDADEERGFRAALEKRPDLLRQIKVIERLGLERGISRNRLLPTLDLSASYSHRGVGEDYSDDLDILAEDDIRSWEVGVKLAYPLGNREARNEALRTELRLKGRRAELRQLHEDVRREIRAAIRQIEVNRNKIEVARRGRELAEEKLRILLRRKEVGLATTRQVLEGEEDLAAAQTGQTAALADYNKAATAYLKATGQLLEHEGVHFAAPPTPEGDAPLLDMDR